MSAADLPQPTGQNGGTLRNYVVVVRRRRWLLLLCVALVPVAAAAFSLTQSKLYEASADVLLNSQNLGAQISGLDDSSFVYDAERQVDTQADFAATPGVAQAVLSTGGFPGATLDSILRSTKVEASSTTNILTFTSHDTNPTKVIRLATAYAHAYKRHRDAVDTQAIVLARHDVEAKLTQLRAQHVVNGPLVSSLVRSDQQLTTLETLQTSRATVIRSARKAAQIQPKVIRNTLLGLILGILLGVAAVAIREALDTRVRIAGDVTARLQMPRLASLGPPPRQLQRENKLVMLEEPSSPAAEAFRVLATSLEFRLMDRDIKSIVVTSAIEEEGKTTTASNLAIALARSGHRVALVDLDLRRPRLSRIFGLEASPGLTMVAIGRGGLEEASQVVPLDRAASGSSPNGSEPGDDGDANERALEHLSELEDEGGTGLLHVVASGPLPPNPGDFVSSPRVRALLDELRATHDLVIVDTPPVLRAGDALTVLSGIDGVLVVARLNLLRTPMLNELHRLLHAVPAQPLGYVLTGVDEATTAGYGYGYGYGGSATPPRRSFRRSKSAAASI